MSRRRPETWVPLGQELAQLERTDPVIRDAARRLDAAARRLLEGRSHPLPCRLPACPWHAADTPRLPAEHTGHSTTSP
jgi:hypothetical protein